MTRTGQVSIIFPTLHLLFDFLLLAVCDVDLCLLLFLTQHLQGCIHTERHRLEQLCPNCSVLANT